MRATQVTPSLQAGPPLRLLITATCLLSPSTSSSRQPLHIASLCNAVRVFPRAAGNVRSTLKGLLKSRLFQLVQQPCLVMSTLAHSSSLSLTHTHHPTGKPSFCISCLQQVLYIFPLTTADHHVPVTTYHDRMA